MGQGSDLLAVSRSSAVQVQSNGGRSRGSGAFVGEQSILTCFHVVAAWTRESDQVRFSIAQDVQVVLPGGEVISAEVITAPTDSDPSPLEHDFAVLRLKTKPRAAKTVLKLATEKDTPSVGDTVVFSGYPLNAPGLVTLRGMVAGFDATSALMFVQAPINKGNSGGALLDTSSRLLGIVSMREGGVSAGLDQLRATARQSAASGTITFMGVDTVKATADMIDTIDQYISTGLGYVRSIKFARAYLERHPGLLK